MENLLYGIGAVAKGGKKMIIEDFDEIEDFVKKAIEVCDENRREDIKERSIEAAKGKRQGMEWADQDERWV